MEASMSQERRGAIAGGQGEAGSDPASLRAAVQGLLASVSAVQDHFIAVATQIRNAAESVDAAKDGTKNGTKDWDELFRGAYLLEQMQTRAAALSVWTDPVGPEAGVSMADPDRPLTGAAIGAPVTLPLGLSLQKLERFWILSTLEALDGNRSLCARHLEVALRTVVRKLGEFKALGHPVPAAVPGRRRRSASAKTPAGSAAITG